MGIRKLVVYEENIIGIREFMNEFLEIPYPFEDKLTHYEMDKYLIEKRLPLPIRINFSKIKPTDILCGKYIAVREESSRLKKGRTLIYENPYKFDSKLIIRDLSYTSNKNRKRFKLDRIRKQLLEKYHNMTLDENGAIIPIEEYKRIKEEESYQVTESINRQHNYQLSRGKHLIKRGRY